MVPNLPDAEINSNWDMQYKTFYGRYVESWGLYHKNYYGRNLGVSVIS